MMDRGPSEERAVTCHRKHQLIDRVMGPTTLWTVKHWWRGLWTAT